MSEIYQRGPITCSVACDDKFDYGYEGGEVIRLAPGAAFYTIK